MKFIELRRAQLDAKYTERDAHLAALDELAAAAETREGKFTDDELVKVTEHRNAVPALKTEIADLERELADLEVEERAVATAASKRHFDAPNVIVKPDAPTPDEVRTLSRGEARDAALRIIGDDNVVSDVASDENRSRVEKLVRTGRSQNLDGDEIARRVALTENDAYRSAFAKACHAASLNRQPVFNADEERAMRAFEEYRAASLTDASGGFGVPVFIDPTIILTSGAGDAPLIRVSRIETITNNVWKGVSSAGVSWSFDAEAAAVSDDAVTLAQPTVTCHAARGFIPYSVEIGMDYPGFASEMMVVLNQGYLDLLAAHTATGTGTAQPFGIITALDANTNVEVTPTTDGSFGAVDIDKVWKELPERFRSRASWAMHVDVENEIRAFGSGTATSRFTVDQTEFGLSRLNGRPVIVTDYFPQFSGTTGASNILVVGDFSNYLIAQRAGMSVEAIPHLFDVTNNRPTLQRGLLAWSRVGADSVNDNGFRLLQNQ